MGKDCTISAPKAIASATSTTCFGTCTHVQISILWEMMLTPAAIVVREELAHVYCIMPGHVLLLTLSFVADALKLIRREW